MRKKGGIPNTKMSMADSERRNKRKDKMRNKKKHPYKKGGRSRTSSKVKG